MARALLGSAVAIAAACVTGAIPAAAQVSAPQVIVLSGDATPSGNGSLSTFQSPALNNQGQVAFGAGLAGTIGGASDDSGIFRADDSSLSTIAREGSGAPDGNGTISTFPSRPVINDVGQVALSIALIGTSGGPSDDRGIFLGDGSMLLTIAREGQAEPGGNGSFSAVSTLKGQALNNAGQVAFHSNLGGTSGGSADDEGVFRGNGSTLVTIARKGTPDPANPGGGTFASFDSDPTLNDSGQVGFHAIVASNPVDPWNMYRGDGTLTTTIARENGPAPDGTFLSIDTDPAIEDSGWVAFKATLDGNSGGAAADHGLFSGDGDSIQTIAREGDAVPDTNGTFADFLPDLAFSDSRQVAFLASLVGAIPPAGLALFRVDPSSTLVEVVREGEIGPGGSLPFTSVGAPALNVAGQVAFVGVLSDRSSNVTSIFLFDDALGLLTIASTGDPMLGSTITGVSFSTGDPPSEEGSGLNDFGQVAYGFTLADGRQGIAIRTVPEPSSRFLLSFGGLALMIGAVERRRRRGVAPPP